ncbi:unnamed protein product [Caenorhabditis nigoni]
MGNRGSFESNLLSQGEEEEQGGKTLYNDLLEENQRLRAELSAIHQQAKPVASLKFDNNSPELGGTITTQAQSGISYDDFKKIPSLVAPQVNTVTFIDRHKEISLEGVVCGLTEILKEVVDNHGILRMRMHSKNINFTFKRITETVKNVRSKLELLKKHGYLKASESDAMKTAMLFIDIWNILHEMEETDDEPFFELLFTLSKKTIELKNVPMYFSHRRQEDSLEVEPMNLRISESQDLRISEFQNLSVETAFG